MNRLDGKGGSSISIAVSSSHINYLDEVSVRNVLHIFWRCFTYLVAVRFLWRLNSCQRLV
jgi:hypothetical protein